MKARLTTACLLRVRGLLRDGGIPRSEVRYLRRLERYLLARLGR